MDRCLRNIRYLTVAFDDLNEIFWIKIEQLNDVTLIVALRRDLDAHYTNPISGMSSQHVNLMPHHCLNHE